MTAPGSNFEVKGSIALYSGTIVSVQISSGAAKPKATNLAKVVIPTLGLNTLIATIAALVPQH